MNRSGTPLLSKRLARGVLALAAASVLAACGFTGGSAPVENRSLGGGTPIRRVDPATLPGYEFTGKPGYYTVQQCQDLAAWKLKRATVLQKSVSIQCSQIFHLNENELVAIVRSDKPGSPVERHLIMGFSRPLGATGQMTINAVSTNDFPIATLTKWPS